MHFAPHLNKMNSTKDWKNVTGWRNGWKNTWNYKINRERVEEKKNLFSINDIVIFFPLSLFVSVQKKSFGVLGKMERDSGTQFHLFVYWGTSIILNQYIAKERHDWTTINEINWFLRKSMWKKWWTFQDRNGNPLQGGKAIKIKSFYFKRNARHALKWLWLSLLYGWGIILLSEAYVHGKVSVYLIELLVSLL